MGVDGVGPVKSAEAVHAHTQLENLLVLAGQWFDLLRLACDDVADGRDGSVQVIQTNTSTSAMAAPPLTCFA